MLNLTSRFTGRDCQGGTRRDFLKVGTAGLAGLTLPLLLAQKARADGGTKSKSVVFLFLCGGASQFETFDPKMTAPDGIRSATGEVQTRLPGVTFGSTFPNLARHADKLAVVRSFQPHGISVHKTAIKTVFKAGITSTTSIGAMSTILSGRTTTGSGLPSFTELIVDEADPEYQQDSERMRSGNSSGNLGPAFSAFNPTGDGQINRNMELHLPLARLNSRRALRNSLDRLNRRVDASGTMGALDKFEQQAMDLILGRDARAALDLSREDPRIVARYDTSRFRIGFRKKRPSDLGQRMLLARRLCEAGCGFVTVGSAGWDHHGNKSHSGVFDGVEKLGRPVDKAVSAFLEDVEERGLSDDILLVIITEFGRSPRIEKNGGRGHWPGVCPLVFAGGGLKMGQVIGRSNPRAEAPQTQPVTPENLLATVLHVLFDVSALRVRVDLPRELAAIIERGEPIRGLI